MSRSSCAFLKGLELMAGHCCYCVLGVSLSFKLIEFIGQQDLASRHAYSLVRVALLQELFCFLEGRLRRGARPKRSFPLTKVLHLPHAMMHARQPLQQSRAEETTGRRPVERSSRPGETGTIHAPSLFGGSVSYPQSPIDAVRKRGDDRPYACARRIASAKTSQTNNCSGRRLYRARKR